MGRAGQYPRRGRARFFFFFFTLAATTAAVAQQPPDAGTILREQPRPPAVPTPKPAAPATEKTAPGPESEGPRVLVRAIRIKGNALIPEAELIARVRDLIGREVAFRELQNAALALTGYYAQKGYLARVFLPPQEIRDGVVEFQVREGVRGALNVERKGERVDAERLRRFIDRRLSPGAPLDFEVLAEALRIMNEYGGISAVSTVSPGRDDRDVAVTVRAEDLPLATFNAGLNNHGSRGTGRLQASGGAALANPTGRFDSASVLVNASEGARYGRGEYSVAAGDSGLRLGVNASALAYRVVQPEFSALGARGTAATVGLSALYPVSRRPGHGLSLTASADSRALVDRTVAGETGNRRVHTASIGTSGYAAPRGVGGLLTFGASVTAGDTDQRNAGALAADQAGRRTQGGFAKLAWNAGLLRPLGADWMLTASARGQFARKNLDSSERFSLGGPSGIRAYPVGEAAGDEGWLFNVALARRLGERLSASAFFDAGRITVNHTIPAGTLTPNRYSLAGVGAGIQWQPFAQSSFNVMLAAPVGVNAGRDANGNNVDGSGASKPRVWLSFTALF